MTGLIYKILNYYRPGSVEPGVTKQIPCIFPENHSHDDRVKSARIYSDSEKYHCFTCGMNLNAIQIVQEMESVSYVNAIKFIEKTFRINFTKPKEYKDPDLIRSYEAVVVDLIIEKQPENFNKFYYHIDKAVDSEDLNKLKKIFKKLQNG